MAKIISRKGSVKTSADKLLGKPLPEDKTPGLETATRFYELEDGYKNNK